MQHIGVDLGGTKTEVAVLDERQGFVLRERLPTPQQRYVDIVATIAQLVARAKQSAGLPAAHPVGVGIPGCIDASTNRVRGANTQALNGQALHADLVQALGCPVAIENDANCLALSEAMDGAAAGAEVAFAVILGTGCGGGICVGQKPWKGRNALAGEWGHNPLPWPTPAELQAPPCWCGQQGCLETWLSGPGLAADDARQNPQKRSPEDIVRAMGQGEPTAVAVWQAYVDRLARGLAQVINFLDPDVIVLGGGLSQVDALYPQVQARVSRYTFHRPITTPIVQALHGDSSGVRGAAWLGHRSW